MRARIALRKRLRREPSVKEIQEALDTKEAFKVDVNHADIARAYDSGDEVSQSCDFRANLFSDLIVIK